MGKNRIVVETELFPHVELYEMLTLWRGSGFTQKPWWTKAQARKEAVAYTPGILAKLENREV